MKFKKDIEMIEPFETLSKIVVDNGVLAGESEINGQKVCNVVFEEYGEIVNCPSEYLDFDIEE